MLVKKIISLIAAAAVCIVAGITVCASANPTRVLDYADLMTDEEEARLDDVLKTVSERTLLDLVVLTSNDTDGKEPKLYAADIYDNYDGILPDRYGYGDTYDGVMMFVDYGDRHVYIIGTGRGEQCTDTDSALNYILDEMWDNVTDGDFAAAGEDFAYTVEYVMENGVPVTPDYPYDPDYPYVPDDPYDYGIRIFGVQTPYTKNDIIGKAVISVIAGLVIGLVVTGVMRKKMKTVRFENGASNYVSKDGLDLTGQSDTFLYSNVTRVAKPKNNDNHSGGSHHSGGGHSSSFSGSSGTHHSGGGRGF